MGDAHPVVMCHVVMADSSALQARCPAAPRFLAAVNRPAGVDFQLTAGVKCTGLQQCILKHALRLEDRRARNSTSTDPQRSEAFSQASLHDHDSPLIIQRCWQQRIQGVR